MSSTNKSEKTLILLGSSGKMGQQILRLLSQDTWKKKFPTVIEINSQSEEKSLGDLSNAVVVDFSKTAATLKWSSFWAQKKIPTLVCTTGFQKDEFDSLKTKFAASAWAFIPNTSLGIFAFIRCLVGLIKFFPDIKSAEIHDVHHIHKKDSPSGTALLIQAALANAGFKGEIPIKSQREGEVVGVHSVILQREYDRFIFTHDAQDRKLFAEGALMLAEKLAAKAPRPQPYSFEELLQ